MKARRAVFPPEIFRARFYRVTLEVISADAPYLGKIGRVSKEHVYGGSGYRPAYYLEFPGLPAPNLPFSLNQLEEVADPAFVAKEECESNAEKSS